MSTHETFAAFERSATKKKSKAPRDPRLAVGYIRVSTDEQQLGPEAQEAAIRSYASRSGLEVVAIVRDIGVSGGAPLDERPGLAEALDVLGTLGASKLIVAKRDRLARDTARAAFVERLVEGAGAYVVSADGVAGGVSPEDKLLRGILDVMAEYERAAIRLRTKVALAAKRRRGERLGQVPYGYTADASGKLHPEPREQAAIAHIVRQRDAGVSWDELVLELQASFPPRGASGRWHRTSAHRIYKTATASRKKSPADSR